MLTITDFLNGKAIYTCLKNFLPTYLNNLFYFLENCQADSFLLIYIREWKLYKHAAHFNSRLLKYLNDNWIYSEISKGTENIFTIKDLSLVSWRSNLSKGIMQKLMEAVQFMVEMESNGKAIYHGQIEDIGDSLGDGSSREKLLQRLQVGEEFRSTNTPL